VRLIRKLAFVCSQKQVRERLLGKVLREINQKVGFRLLTKAGERGGISLSKLMPVLNGLIRGTIGVLFVHSCATAAKRYFVWVLAKILAFP
jgi:hypothetical protein